MGELVCSLSVCVCVVKIVGKGGISEWGEFSLVFRCVRKKRNGEIRADKS